MFTTSDKRVTKIHNDVWRIIDATNNAEFTIVGCTHFSPLSEDTVKKLLSEDEYDTIMVELCKDRLEIVEDPTRFIELKTPYDQSWTDILDIQRVITGLLTERVLDGVFEMAPAIKYARKYNKPIVCIDTDIKDIWPYLQTLFINTVKSYILPTLYGKKVTMSQDKQQLGSLCMHLFNSFTSWRKGEHISETDSVFIRWGGEWCFDKIFTSISRVAELYEDNMHDIEYILDFRNKFMAYKLYSYLEETQKAIELENIYKVDINKVSPEFITRFYKRNKQIRILVLVGSLHVPGICNYYGNIKALPVEKEKKNGWYSKLCGAVWYPFGYAGQKVWNRYKKRIEDGAISFTKYLQTEFDTKKTIMPQFNQQLDQLDQLLETIEEKVEN